MNAGIVVGLVFLVAFTALAVRNELARGRRLEKLREAPGPVSAYGVDDRLELVELGPLSLARGLELLEERYEFAGIYFERAEDAMAKTRIGFRRTDHHFIEIDLIDAGLTLVRAGLDITDGRDEESVEIGNIEAVRAIVAAYFSRAADFGDYWRGLDQRRVLR